MSAQHEQLQQRLGYRFAAPKLLERALHHPSSSAEHYQRLEFLGDSFIGLSVATELYRRFPEASEGVLTQMKSQLVRGVTMTDIAREIKLQDVVQMAGAPDTITPSVLEDAFEALFGAIWLDSSWDVASPILLGLYAPRLDKLNPDSITKPAKNILQEHAQANSHPLPKYSSQSIATNPQEPKFIGHCDYEGQRTSAKGRSKALAEGEAARKMLDTLP